jgi:lipopolysaccharide export system protein LptA
MKHYLLHIAIAFLLSLALIPSRVWAQSQILLGPTSGTGGEPIVITSDTLELDTGRKQVIFDGNVDARNDIFILTCERVVLHYLSSEKSDKEEEENPDIDKIIASGNVKIIRLSGGEATAEKAVYYQLDEKIVLTGQPLVKQGNDFVEGSKITFFLKDKRSIVEGSGNRQVRAVLSPDKTKKVQSIGRE